MSVFKKFKLTSKGLISLIVLTLLIVCAVILNCSLKNKQERTRAQIGGGDTGNAEIIEDTEDKAVNAGVYRNYFEDFRDERNAVRGQEIDYLRMIINADDTDKETLQGAQLRLMELVESMEKEFSIESMIRSKGFLDAAVTMRNNSISVVIMGESLTDEEVARILDIVRGETGASASKVKISLNSQKNG